MKICCDFNSENKRKGKERLRCFDDKKEVFKISNEGLKR